MKKYRVMKVLLAGLMVIIGTTGVAMSAEWRLGHVLPPDHPGNRALEAAASEIAEKTKGRVEIKVFPAGQIGGAKEVLTGMTIGTHQMAFDGAGILSQWNKHLGVFEAPFLAKDFHNLDCMINSSIGKEIFTELLNEHKFRVLDIWYYGTRHVTNNQRPINSVADMDGLKIRVPEVALSLSFIKALGAQPTPMSFSELYLSLQTGVVDGQENPLPTIKAAKFFEVQDYLALTGHLVQFVAPIVAEDVWAATSESDRAVIMEVFTRVGDNYNDGIIELEASLVETLGESGMQITTPKRQPFVDAMSAVYEEYDTVWGAGVYSRLAAIK